MMYGEISIHEHCIFSQTGISCRDTTSNHDLLHSFATGDINHSNNHTTYISIIYFTQSSHVLSIPNPSIYFQRLLPSFQTWKYHWTFTFYIFFIKKADDIYVKKQKYHKTMWKIIIICFAAGFSWKFK